jgi:hypothetical protein
VRERIRNLEYHNKARKEEEKRKVVSVHITQRSLFKLMFGNLKVSGLALNLVSLFITLSTSILLARLRSRSVGNQISERIC